MVALERILAALGLLLGRFWPIWVALGRSWIAPGTLFGAVARSRVKKSEDRLVSTLKLFLKMHSARVRRPKKGFSFSGLHKRS